MRFHSVDLHQRFDYAAKRELSFGLSAAILAPTLAGGLGALGVAEGTAAALSPVLAGGLTGAAGGAALGGLTGGDPLMGALTGGVGGGLSAGFGPALGEAAGIGTTAGKALISAGTSAAGSALTGGDPLTAALAGGALPLVSSAFGGSGTTTPTSTVTPTPTTGAGGGTSAVSATSGVTPSGGTPVDLSQTGGLYSVGDGAGATSGSGTSGLDKALGWLEKNPMAALGVAGLAGQVLAGPPGPGKAELALQQHQGEAASMARTLGAYRQSGTLPSGLQSVVDQQFESAKAAVVDQYGKLGLGNSTMMQDKLNQLKQQKTAEMAQFAERLAREGIAWENLSASELSLMVQAEQSRDAAFRNALGSFARGLAGGVFKSGDT